MPWVWLTPSSASFGSPSRGCSPSSRSCSQPTPCTLTGWRRCTVSRRCGGWRAWTSS
uniref:Uncharacterized protein n=1 Tax=Arundo donax TaxID=35708 RepID=A0A0A9EFK8_ARUDO